MRLGVLIALGMVASLSIGYVLGRTSSSPSASAAATQSPKLDRSPAGGALVSSAPATAGMPSSAASAAWAPEPAPMSPTDVRDEQRKALAASGPAKPDVLDKARALEAAWSALAAKRKLTASFGEWACYAAGCIVTVQHSNVVELEEFTKWVTQSREFNAWPGGKLRTAAIQDSRGKAEAAWVLSLSEEG